MLKAKPDLFLAEMKVMLRQSNGVEVGDSTVWRYLKSEGYSMKKVRLEARSPPCLTPPYLDHKEGY